MSAVRFRPWAPLIPRNPKRRCLPWGFLLPTILWRLDGIFGDADAIVATISATNRSAAAQGGLGCPHCKQHTMARRCFPRTRLAVTPNRTLRCTVLLLAVSAWSRARDGTRYFHSPEPIGAGLNKRLRCTGEHLQPPWQHLQAWQSLSTTGAKHPEHFASARQSAAARRHPRHASPCTHTKRLGGWRNAMLA